LPLIIQADLKGCNGEIAQDAKDQLSGINGQALLLKMLTTYVLASAVSHAY